VKSTRLAAVLAGAVAVTGLVTTAGTATAASSTGCEGGAFAVTLPSGRVVKGDQELRLDSRGLTSASVLKVRGRYVEFTYAPTTGAITNYVYTGAANPLSMTSTRTPVWASKTLDKAPGNRGRTEIRFAGEHVRLVTSGGIKVKIQAKDCATGGVFQQEAETENGTPVVATHRLAAGAFYYVNPYTTKLNVGNGAGYVAKDSAQVAERLSQTDTTSVWRITSGGRMGFVTGEDAVELSAGSSNCVQDCQAQNRVRGSLPVTDPAFQDINDDAFVALAIPGDESEDD
jgi:hypothetical protein